MDFTFSSEQDELRRSMRAFLVARSPASHVAAMESDPLGTTPALWDDLAALGAVGLLVPASHGGAGAGLVDALVVLEEVGRVPFPGPYWSSAVFATLAARRLGLDDRFAALASGATRAAIALEEQGGGDPVARVRTRGVRDGGRWLLTGTKPIVIGGYGADWVLVVARTERGIGTFVLEAPDLEPVPAWDVTRKVARLVLEGREAEPVGPDGDHTALWRRIVDDANVGTCAELVGSMESAFELAVEFAKVRVQFGRPIAAFQAIKHKAAEMLQRIELARVGTHYAAWASDVEDPVREEAAAMAKAFVAEAAIAVTSEAIQIHGGVGFTWDCPAHLHYRKAKQADLLLGYQGHQRRRLADLVIGTD
ncbi:MAG: acyl-CoA dehydrogenase family protein [Acidimicrobiales bacterium]